MIKVPAGQEMKIAAFERAGQRCHGLAIDDQLHPLPATADIAYASRGTIVDGLGMIENTVVSSVRVHPLRKGGS